MLVTLVLKRFVTPSFGEYTIYPAETMLEDRVTIRALARKLLNLFKKKVEDLGKKLNIQIGLYFYITAYNIAQRN